MLRFMELEYSLMLVFVYIVDEIDGKDMCVWMNKFFVGMEYIMSLTCICVVSKYFINNVVNIEEVDIIKLRDLYAYIQ